jgi:membrane-anchored protein YejM (alkaline phosphatase superfamily)
VDFSLPQVAIRSVSSGSATSPVATSSQATWRGFARLFFFAGARLAFGSFLLLTSLYCLLAWVPFSYFGFIRNPLVSWIPVFVRFHGLIYGVLLTPVAITLIPDLRRMETRRITAAFLLFNGSAAIYLWCEGALAALQPDFTSYLWSMFSLFPLLWLAALDLLGKQSWPLPENRNGLDLAKTTLAAIIISLVFAITSTLHAALLGGNLSGSLALQGLGASLCFHLSIFAAFGLVLGFIKRATRGTPWPATLNAVLARVFAWLLLSQALRRMIFPTISFEGTQATILADVLSFVVVLFASGFASRLRSLALVEWPQTSRTALPVWLWGLAALGLFAAAYSIPMLLGRTDWDFVLQRMAVIALWLLVLQTICWSGVQIHGKAASIAILLVLTAAGAGFVRYAKLTLYNPEPSPMSQGILDTYAGADISFKTAYDVLSHPVDNKAYRQFYEFLKQNTNLDRNSVASPGDLRLVSDLQPAAGIKPNIFLFVIDSLRQDYVSPYNPAVAYTPQIDRFAHESVVLQNAYTRYGGTALSEPAIWVGAMQLHKQYIEPFYPMNNLQKLLDADGYQSYISVDPILSFMLHPSPSITELDKGSSWSDLDLIPTLKELEAKIDQRSDPKKPIFAYTQPQNVHTLTLERSKIKGGRKAVSISELRRMDAAFGEFVGFLQRRGLYENSIIILTADHGDSYGEFGRYGHSDFLFPEIIRIPMIVHLPPRMREQLVWDARQVAFTTDITPSLYYLLGHRPIVNNELFGRPIFTQTRQEQSAYQRTQYLIVSSYAPVYAILGGDSHSLFIVDAVNSKNYYYNLAEDSQGTHNHVTIQLRNEYEALIRRDVGMINDLYGWHPGQSPH